MSRFSGLQCRVAESPNSHESVMGLLMDNAGSEFTESQVRELLGLPKSTTHRALKELSDQGLVSTTAVGRTLTYRMDADDPLIRHLKIARAIARARAAVAPLADDVDMAVLFGSGAKGADSSGSDLDLFVVTSAPDRVLGALSRHERIQPVVMTPAQHMLLIAEGGTFARAIADGIPILSSR
ncbi:MAG: MarR family transcriptional regulator [Coriobacteriia bacterium]|nr:MarR family transcriptional regulator [Coriobacteriia bacterium]